MDTDTLVRDVSPFIESIARRAGDTVMQYYEGSFRVDRKNEQGSSIDIVTDADRASEDLILDAIRREFPDHDIVSEESDIALTGAEYRWVVDPLDGTVNFAHGYPFFSISIALMHHDDLVAGAVFEPLRKDLFSAVRGHGATLNGNSIRTSEADRLKASVIATGFPYDRDRTDHNNSEEFKRVMPNVQGVRRGGSAALDLSYVAAGRLDGFWEFKLKPWDIAAGVLLVREAGGTVTDLDRKPIKLDTYGIVATNGRIHDDLIDLLRGKGEAER